MIIREPEFTHLGIVEDELRYRNDIIDLEATDNNIYYVKEDGSVKSIGININGEMGIGKENSGFLTEEFYRANDLLEKTLAVSEGKDFHVILKTDGTVWTYGKNDVGQLGIGQTLGCYRIPCEIKIKNVTAISAGREYCMALDNEGNVWSWGSNKSGQLGNGSYENTAVPVKVSFGNVKIKSISAGNEHSMAVSESNEVYVWGSNESGQLGINDGSIKSLNIPVKLNMTNVKMASAGINHSVVLKADGTVYTFGDNLYGQLGTGNFTKQMKPKSIGKIGREAEISAGGYHTIVRTSDGEIKGCGKAEEGQLGVNYSENQCSLVSIELTSGNGDSIRAKKIEAGAYLTCAIGENNELYGFGTLHCNMEDGRNIETELKYTGEKLTKNQVKDVSVGYNSFNIILYNLVSYLCPEYLLDEEETQNYNSEFEWNIGDIFNYDV